jgi:cAMP-binding proteins - catabolite gene activator and regulatory subunit of cAMP-dependent protein kinases
MDIGFILEQSDFFKGVSAKSKQALAEICIRKTLHKNEVIFSEGDNGHSLYLLASGNVRVFKSTPDGKETVIKVLRPGDIFAEVVLFERDVYPASAVALKNSIIYVLPKRQFYELLSDQNFRNDFIRMLMKKQRYLADKLHALTAYNVEERFIRFLLEQYGKKTEYRILLTKKDIASAIGTIPETMSRLLGRMQREGKISVKGNIIKLKSGFWQERI